MMTTNAFIDGVMKFANMEVLPKMPNGLNKFLGYMAIGAVQKNPATVFCPYFELMRSVGIIHDDEIDTELLKAALENGFKQQSSLTLAGFSFNENDIPSLFKYLS